MIRPIEVEAREGYRIWLRCSDGRSTEKSTCRILPDVASYAAWDEPGRFQQVRIARHRAITWDADIALCPDALSMQLTGKTFEQTLGVTGRLTLRLSDPK